MSMSKWCPNCGRPMDDFELGSGPGGLGCICCTNQCPNCGREVFDTDIIHRYFKTCCKYCEAEVQEEIEKTEESEEEEWRILEDALNNDDEEEDDLDHTEIDEETLNKVRNMSKEELDALGKELGDQIQNLYEDIMKKMKK